MDGIEALPTKSELFDRDFEENQRLFFEPADANEGGAAQDSPPTTDETDVIRITTELPSDDVPETAPNRSGSWRPIALLGGTVLACAGLFAVLIEYGSPSQPDQPPPSTERSISLTSFPNQLPAAVKARIGDVGIVVDEIYDSQTTASLSDDYESASWVSGVQIRPNLALTAGQLVSSSSAELNSATECQQVSFTTKSGEDFLAKGYATTQSSQSPKTPELGSLELPQRQPGYPSKNEPPRNITIAPKPPKPGEQLFFVNYENKSRGQYYNVLDGNGAAIYGGIYLGTYSNGNYEVLTGLKSYGHNRDTSSGQGSEGGAIFDRWGRLVALGQYSWATKSSSIKQYEKWEAVQLTGDSPNKRITDTYVQPVTKALADKYEQDKQPITQDCFQEARAS